MNSQRPMLRRATRVVAILASLLTLTLLSACVGIPASGPVHDGLTSFSQGERSVEFNPSPPVAGSSQEDIVRGFVRAASSAADDYAIARQFLTPTYASQWDTTLGVTIDEGTQQYTALNENVGVLTLSVVGHVDAQGKFVPGAPEETHDAKFELSLVQGEWRISSAPAGIILDRNTFVTAWTAKQVYYLNAAERLVSDARWFLNRDTLGTQIVNALLSGPSDAMGEVLHSAFPAGTTLAGSSVPIVSGAARIELTPELLDASRTERELIKQQLATSLQSVPGVSRFELLVSGTLVDQGQVSVADSGGGTSDTHFVSVMRDGVFGPVVGTEVQELEGIGARVVALEPRAVSLNDGRTAAAVLHAGGVSWLDAERSIVIDSRAGLVTPSLDSQGYVWTYSQRARDTITASMPGGAFVNLEMPWLEGRAATAVRVSPSGNRLAVLVAGSAADGRSDLSEVLIVGIVRDEDGHPLAFSSVAVPQLWATGSPIDLDWVDEARFAALTRLSGSGNTSKVSIGVLSQFALDSSNVTEGASISGSGTRQRLRVLDEDGYLYAPQGSGWQLQMGGVELVAKVG